MNVSSSRKQSRQDHWLAAIETAMRTLAGANRAQRPMPQADSSPELLARERKTAGALMRVNHVGEVCAQALYSAQSLTTRDPGLKETFAYAAHEEKDHLAWTEQRLNDLNARPSLLNPAWYAGAFCIGWLAGRVSDPVSLGFVAETERQVEQHLASHLERLPEGDFTSRAIVNQMIEDESRHGAQARDAGAIELPWAIREAMQAAAKIMTTIAYRI